MRSIYGLVWLTAGFLVCDVAIAQQPQLGPPVAPQAQRPAPQMRPMAGAPINAPFRLTPEQEAYLDQVLIAWEQNTENIKSFKCDFDRWNYNPAFEHPQYKQMPITVNKGDLKYAKPDKGTFRVHTVQHLNTKTGKYETDKEDPGEHWVCDGEAIWEYDNKQKRVIERPIPAEMQGQALRHTPLPFLFGSKATELKQRYFLRVVTPKEFAETEIWIDSFPRWRQDAANFQRAILRMSRDKGKEFQPIALRIYDPGDRYASYEFSNIKINDRFEGLKELFQPPRTPWGWRRILELPPEAQANNSAK
jgi:TIGR03009 family protein